MALIVGNLLNDPTATSFISLEDAIAYLQSETYSGATDPVSQWLAADVAVQEASLVSSSRWLASYFEWLVIDLSESDIVRVGRAAARLAVTARTTDLYKAVNTTRNKKSVKAGSVAVSYENSVDRAQAAGLYWPWLLPLLRGLVRVYDPRIGLGVLVV